MAAINLPIVSKFDDKGIKQATGAFDGITGQLGKIAGVIATAFSVRAITNFAKESIAAAEGVAVANNRIDQIAKSMNLFGEETQAVADRLKAYAEANELNLATDAEVIKATQAKLLTFRELGLTADDAGGAFDRATAAAIDLAAAGFGSAETNAVQLGKALQDPIKGISALRRAGITFTEAEKEKIATLVESGNILEAQNLVLAAIETQVGGTAAATATASQKMQLAFDNVKETVGAALMPAFASLAEAMIPIAEEIAPILESAIQELSPTFEQLAASLPDLIASLTPLIPTFLELIGMITELAINLLPILVAVFDSIVPILQFVVAGMVAVSDIVEANIEVFSALVIGLLAGVAAFKTFQAIQIAITTAQGALAVAQKLFTVVTGQATLAQAGLNTAMLANPIGLVIAAIAALVAGLVWFFTQTELGQEIWRNFTKFLREAFDNFVEFFGDAVRNVSTALGNLGKFFGDTFTNIRNAVIKGVGDFGKLLFDAGRDLIQGLVDGIFNFGAKIGKALVDVVNNGVKGVKDFLGIRSPSRVFYEIGEDVTTGLADGINDSAFLVQDAANQLATYTTSAASKIESAFDKSITVISSIPGIAGSAMKETIRITMDDVRRMAAETAGLFAAFDKKGNLLRSYTGMGQPNLVPDVTGQLFDVGKATDDLNAIYRYAGAQTARDMEKIQNDLFGGSFQDALDALTGQRTFIDPRTGQSTTISTSDPTTMANAVAEAIAKGLTVVEPLTTSVEELKDRITSVSSQVAEKGLIPIGLARGGFVDQATLAVVGEAGPEVVMPLDRFESALARQSGAGDNYTYNVSVTAGMGSDPVSIGREVVNAIKRYESVSGKVFVSA